MKYLSQKNGFLGYDANQNIEPKVIVVPFGLEKTVSYGSGTKNGPSEIIKASHQVELFDEELNKYIIVDGFHRYFVCKSNKDISEKTHGKLPVVVIEKDINDRMASTVRHNRARGSHSVDGMANMVFSMLDEGWEDSKICNHLGMEPEELLRLKHITGFSKLFANTEYKKSWVTKSQILIKKKYESKEN